VGEDLIAGDLVGAGEIRAAKQEAGDTLRRVNVVGDEEVGCAGDEDVVGTDMGRSLVVAGTRALCGCRRGTHLGGDVVQGGLRGGSGRR
jgi:hypothetical protein